MPNPGLKAIRAGRVKRLIVESVLRLNSWLGSHNGAKSLFSEGIPVHIHEGAFLRAPTDVKKRTLSGMFRLNGVGP